MKRIYLITFLLLSPIIVIAEQKLQCYKNNISLGNDSFDNLNYKKSILYYKKSYNCASTRKEKIISLASLATSEMKSNNKETSKEYIEKILSISPNNKWAEKFKDNNWIDDNNKFNFVDRYIRKQENKLGGYEYPKVRKIIQGDINGDKINEIIVYYSLEGIGGSNTGSPHLAVFENSSKNNKYIAHTSIQRYGRSLKVVNNKIILKTSVHAPSDAMCCPSLVGETSYKINNHKITKIGSKKPTTEKKEELLDGNEIIKKITNRSITTFEKKNLYKKHINKEYKFYGWIRDIKSLREIDLRLNYSNYATVKFKSDIPIENLKKETPILIKGKLTFLGSGILFQHSIDKATLVNYK